jgi:predicted nucleotidyltransferase
VLDELGLEPGEAIKRVDNGGNDAANDAVIKIVDRLVELHPTAAYVLLGSRARHSARKYSDIDIGVYSKDKLSTDQYLALLDIKEGVEDEIPWFVDLVNLNNADSDFLNNIAPDLRFLGGRQGDWKVLQERCHE